MNRCEYLSERHYTQTEIRSEIKYNTKLAKLRIKIKEHRLPCPDIGGAKGTEKHAKRAINPLNFR